MKKLLTIMIFAMIISSAHGYIDIFEGPCAGMTDYECPPYCDSNSEIFSECSEYYSDQEWFQQGSSGSGNYEIKEMNVEIEVSPETIKFGSTLKKIMLRFYFEDGSPVNPNNIRTVEVFVLGENYNRNDFEADETENALVLNLNKKFSIEEFMRYTGDEVTEDTSIRVNYAEENSGGRFSGGKMIKLEFDAAAEDFKIVLKEWQSACYGTEQVVEFSLLSEGKKLMEAKASIFEVGKNSYIDCNFLAEKSSDSVYKFACAVPVPKESQAPSSELGFGVIAEAFEASLGGEKQTAVKTLHFNLENNVEMNAVYPMDRGSFVPEDAKEAAKLKIMVRCMGSPNLLGVGQLNAEVNGKEITLTKNENEECFEAENVFMDIKLNEPFEIRISLLDDFAGNEFQYETFFEKRDFGGDGSGGEGDFFGKYPEDYIVPLIAAIAVIAAVVAIFMLKRKRETVGQLEGQKEELLGLMKQIEIEYYKRRISEADYKKRLLEYQEKLRLLEVKLGIRKKEAEAKGKK